MKSYSLLTLLFVVTLVALTVSQIMTMKELAEARAEVDSIRRKYGWIRIEDESKAYVSRFVNDDRERMVGGFGAQQTFRIVVPAGSRYLLHLTDAVAGENSYSGKLTPTKTFALDRWRNGADAVISCRVSRENNSPRVVVHTETDLIFDYLPPNWSVGYSHRFESWPDLVGQQTEFATDETIRLYWCREVNAQRGFMLWLEPQEKWAQRRDAEKNATNQSDQDASEQVAPQ